MYKKVNRLSEPQPSLAQSCNEDVLHEILSYVEAPRQLSQTALVCRSWLLQSRVWLYMHVRMDPILLANSQLKLSRTLETNALLISLVREVTVICTTAVDQLEFQELYTWLLLLPTDQILRLNLSFREGNRQLLEHIMSCPFAKGVQHLRIDRRQTLEIGITFSDFLLRFPAVKYLRADVPVCCASGDIPCISTHITHLNLSLWPPSIIPSLNSIGGTGTLTHLSLKATEDISFELSTASQTLHQVAKNLISLTVHCSTTVTQTHLVHAFIKYAIRLEHLECGLSTYDPELLFRRLPGTLKRLKVYSNSTAPFPFDSALTVVRAKQRGESQLQTLTLIRNIYDHERQFMEFRKTCRRVGIDFRYTMCALKSLQELRLIGVGNHNVA